jgi:hypothetical protein
VADVDGHATLPRPVGAFGRRSQRGSADLVLHVRGRPLRGVEPHDSAPAIRSVIEECGLDSRGPKADEFASLRPSPKAVDGAGRYEDEGAWTYSLHGVSVGVEGVTPFHHIERLRLIMRVRRVIEAGVLRRLAQGPVSARFGAGSLPPDVRTVRSHRQNQKIAIARPAEDHSWPLLLHRPPFRVSARKSDTAAATLAAAHGSDDLSGLLGSYSEQMPPARHGLRRAHTDAVAHSDTRASARTARRTYGRGRKRIRTFSGGDRSSDGRCGSCTDSAICHLLKASGEVATSSRRRLRARVLEPPTVGPTGDHDHGDGTRLGNDHDGRRTALL